MNYIDVGTKQKKNLFRLVFWLILLSTSVLVRLYHFHSAIDDHHVWRQTDTAAISRNFFEEDFNILHPRIDWRGNTTGEVECEFPLYQWLVAGFYKITGNVQEEAGRGLSIISFIVTLVLLYRLSREYFGKLSASLSVIILSFLPMAIFFTRAFMPESMMLMGTLGTLYYYKKYIELNSTRCLLMSIMFGMIAFSVKIPSLYIGIPMMAIALDKDGFKTFKRIGNWVYAVLTLLPTAGWYLHSHNLYKKTGLTFGIWDIGHDKWGNLNIWTGAELYKTLLGRMWGSLFTSTGFILLVSSIFILFFSRKIKEKKIMLWWLFSLTIYFMLIARGNLIHDYYQLPFILPASILVGFGLSELSTSNKSFMIFSISFVSIYLISINFVDEISKIRILKYAVMVCITFYWFAHSIKTRGVVANAVLVICITLILMESFYQIRGFYRHNTILTEASECVRNLIDTNKRAVIIYDRGRQPDMFYFTHLKGWAVKTSKPVSYLENFINSGAGYVIVLIESTPLGDYMTNTESGKFLTEHYSYTKGNGWILYIIDKKIH